MTEKNVRIPNAGRPITIEPSPQRVVVTAVGRKRESQVGICTPV